MPIVEHPAHGDYIYLIKVTEGHTAILTLIWLTVQPLQLYTYTDLSKDSQQLKREDIICSLTYQDFTLWPTWPTNQSANVLLILLNDKPQFIVYGYGL